MFITRTRRTAAVDSRSHRSDRQSQQNIFFLSSGRASALNRIFSGRRFWKNSIWQANSINVLELCGRATVSPIKRMASFQCDKRLSIRRSTWWFPEVAMATQLDLPVWAAVRVKMDDSIDKDVMRVTSISCDDDGSHDDQNNKPFDWRAPSWILFWSSDGPEISADEDVDTNNQQPIRWEQLTISRKIVVPLQTQLRKILLGAARHAATFWTGRGAGVSPDHFLLIQPPCCFLPFK